METIIGYKGFDKDLKCRDFQYEVGKEYEIAESPKMCSRGFHFCKSMKQVFAFYPMNMNNRYCLVEAWGLIEHNSDKSVSNRIRIVKELTNEDICAYMEGINLYQLKKVCDNGGIICGSFALKLQGFDLERPIKDIDIIIPYKMKAVELFKDFQSTMNGSVQRRNDNHLSFRDKNGEMSYDVFIKDETYKEVVYYGVTLKVSNPLSIWRAKLSYALQGYTKHWNDFTKFKDRLSFQFIVMDKGESLGF